MILLIFKIPIQERLLLIVNNTTLEQLVIYGSIISFVNSKLTDDLAENVKIFNKYSSSFELINSQN